MIATELNMVGFFAETCPQLSRKLPSILTAERMAVDHDQRLKILDYLENGHLLGAALGEIAWDPFTMPHSKLAGEIKMLTEGKWVSPSSLPYFVSKYDILIRKEFVEDMNSNNWFPPRPLDVPNPHAKSPEVNNSQSHKCSSITIDFDSIFSSCISLEDVFKVSVANTNELVSKLKLQEMNEKERLDLVSALTHSDVPPKFVLGNGITFDQNALADAKSTQFVEMLADQNRLPLSWDDNKVVWLKLEGNERKVTFESWGDAFA